MYTQKNSLLAEKTNARTENRAKLLYSFSKTKFAPNNFYLRLFYWIMLGTQNNKKILKVSSFFLCFSGSATFYCIINKILTNTENFLTSVHKDFSNQHCIRCNETICSPSSRRRQTLPDKIQLTG